MKNPKFTKKTLTGGGLDALDGIPASVLNFGDEAFVEETQQRYILIDWDEWKKLDSNSILRPDK